MLRYLKERNVQYGKERGAQPWDIDSPSKRRCEARQPQTIPCSSLPSSRITRLRQQSRLVSTLHMYNFKTNIF